MERRFYSQPVPIEPGKPFKIEAGWWGWGHYVEFGPDQQEADSDREWVAFFKLVKMDGDLSGRHLDLDALARFEIGDAESNYAIDRGMKEPRIKIGELPVVFVLRRASDKDHLGGVEIHQIAAPSSKAAVELALAYFNYLSALMTMMFQIPLRHAALVVHPSELVAPLRYRVYHPWADWQFSAFNMTIPATPLIARLLTLYAEGVASNSHAYQFLCFYKIVDHVLDHAGALRLFHDRYPSAPWVELQDVLPEDPIKFFDADLVGKKYTQARERYRTTELRNAIAHILPNGEYLDPLDPIHASHYSAASIVCRFMAQHLIRIVGNNAKALIEAGANAQEIMDLLFS